MLKVLFFCGILTVSMSVDLKSEGAVMDITTKKGRRGRKDIDRIIVEKAAEVIFLPCSPIIITAFMKYSISGREAAVSC